MFPYFSRAVAIGFNGQTQVAAGEAGATTRPVVANLAVCAEARGQGLAKSLMKTAEDRCKELGYEEVSAPLHVIKELNTTGI